MPLVNLHTARSLDASLTEVGDAGARDIAPAGRPATPQSFRVAHDPGLALRFLSRDRAGSTPRKNALGGTADLKVVIPNIARRDRPPTFQGQSPGKGFGVPVLPIA